MSHHVQLPLVPDLTSVEEQAHANLTADELVAHGDHVVKQSRLSAAPNVPTTMREIMWQCAWRGVGGTLAIALPTVVFATIAGLSGIGLAIVSGALLFSLCVGALWIARYREALKTRRNALTDVSADISSDVREAIAAYTAAGAAGRLAALGDLLRKKGYVQTARTAYTAAWECTLAS
jgi:hypothetical protein